MKINKKVLAILTGLTVGMSSTAFAAMADSFTDVPKDQIGRASCRERV